MGRALLGMAAGLVSGFLGVGGGTVLVPGLALWLGVDEHTSHGTALAVVLPTTLASTLVYVRRGLVDLNLAAWLAAGGVAGAYLGARLMPGIPGRTLRRMLAAFLLFTGLQLVWRR